MGQHQVVGPLDVGQPQDIAGAGDGVVDLLELGGHLDGLVHRRLAEPGDPGLLPAVQDRGVLGVDQLGDGVVDRVPGEIDGPRSTSSISARETVNGTRT
ncbi:hypothetical protein A8L58_00015 [Acidipropionibacterium acidipropionici]|uniref:Uncharacterized protein n=1 Tax=Acidipropionibacterium acidipropionici TaxID=1748 RepID=A0ABM6FGY8_9ACTN|nr:hypothetical protein A8L58_00015 [Acidipropionibacterium acidipropionici]